MNDQMYERGKQLFVSVIDNYIASAPQQNAHNIDIGLLQWLRDNYKNHVTPIAFEGTFAANRFANACIKSYEENNGQPDVYDCLCLAAENNYKATEKIGEHTVRHISEEEKRRTEETTKAIETELNIASNNLQKQLVYNLIEDTPVEELDIEGLRFRGLIPANFDATEGSIDDLEIGECNGCLMADVMTDEYGNIVLMCPQCGSNSLILETVSGCCLDCDCEFDMPLNLSDSLEDGAIAEYPDFTDAERAVKRVSGDKKHRGIVIVGEDHPVSAD